MNTGLVSRPHYGWRLIINMVVIVSLLSTQFLRPFNLTVVHAEKEQKFIGALITVGALLIAGKLAKDGIDDSISKVNDDVAARMRQAREEIEKLINLIEEKYQDNLELTLNSLDEFAAGQFARAYDLIMDINQEIQRTVGVVEDATVRVIEKAGAELRVTVDYITEKVEQIVIVAAESGVWVIDNVWETIISVLALIFLIGVILIAYTQVGAIMRTEKLPSPRRLGIYTAISVVLLIVGLTLLLSKPARSYIMSRSVSALQTRLAMNVNPDIFSVIPYTLTKGQQDTELKIIGDNLPNETPTVTVGNVTVPVKIFQKQLVVVTLSGNALQLSGVQEVKLTYPSLKQPLADYVEYIEQGPDLIVESVTATPSRPTAGDTFKVKVVVTNQGSQVTAYTVEMNYGLPNVPSSQQNVTQTLAQGASAEFTFSGTYTTPGDFTAFA
ncbi:MAG: CARDB domain-containing protein [Anaerolineae bacterium]